MQMIITNEQSGTNVHEIADGIYRINTPVVVEGGPGGFSFNQYLVVDDEPLIFHTGPRKMFPLVREAVASILPVERLRYIAFSHVEAWECGYLMEESTRTLLCGDLFTQGGAHNPAVTESDILGPSEAFRRQMDYFSHTKNAAEMIERL